MSEDHSDLSTRLQAILAQEYGETSAGFEVSGPIHRGLYGEVYRVRLPANGVELAAKICLSPKLRGTHGYFAERQFKEMRIFCGALANSLRFRVPRPVAVAPEYGILVMEWAEGENLSKIARFGSRDKLVDGMAMAGAWLRHFHRACPRATPQPLRNTLIEEVAMVREKIAETRVTMPEAHRGLSMLSEGVDQISGAGLEQSWLHSDFQPSNIIIGRRSVYGIDMAFAAYGYALMDAAHFF